MTIYNLCAVLSSLQGWTIVPNAFLLPTVFLKELHPEDSFRTENPQIERDALRLLEKIGLRNARRIDLPGERPHYEGSFLEVPLLAGARRMFFGGSSDREDEIGWTYGLLKVHDAQPDRRYGAALAPFFAVEDDLFTTPRTAEGLNVRLGSALSAAVVTVP